MRTRFIALGASGLIAIIGVVGCGNDNSAVGTSTPAMPATATSSAAAASSPPENPYGAPSVDPPAPNEPVLTVTGGRTPLSLTMDQLNALGNTTITVDEPFVKKRQTFSGVPLAVLLEKAGIPESATINTVALNSYHYASAAQPMTASDALIATMRDGAPIPYDQGGPTRLVFPDGTALSSVLDAWNWSLESISVADASAGGS